MGVDTSTTGRQSNLPTVRGDSLSATSDLPRNKVGGAWSFVRAANRFFSSFCFVALAGRLPSGSPWRECTPSKNIQGTRVPCSISSVACKILAGKVAGRLNAPQRRRMLKHY